LNAGHEFLGLIKCDLENLCRSSNLVHKTGSYSGSGVIVAGGGEEEHLPPQTFLWRSKATYNFDFNYLTIWLTTNQYLLLYLQFVSKP